jgi:phenylalanyl-tRNA synthetase alpha chain
MTDSAALVESLHPHEVKALAALAAPSTQSLNDEELAKHTNLEVAQVGAALGRLQLKGLVAVRDEDRHEVVSLTDIGERYLQEGSPLARIREALRIANEQNTPLTIKDVQNREGLAPGEISGVIGMLKQEGSIIITGGGVLELVGTESRTARALQELLSKTKQRGPADLQQYGPPEQSLIEKFAQKRGDTNQPFRVDTRVIRRFGVTDLGKSIATQLAQEGAREEVAQVTPQMLKDGSWRNVRFRKYTIGLKPERPKRVGKKHPYREFLDLVKAKFVGMGFEEMRGPLVENEFWDMDALFMPQFHPARDIHDVYFVKNPTHSTPIPERLLKQVQQTHETGWKTGSSGWGYRFDPMRARRLILRSQGTAVSARTLAGKPKVPGKYFSIARCFRYDQVDATHAPDFYQIEGIVLGSDINFRTLLGLLNLFAREIAQAQESKFLPAYFPFTEPSVELHVRHPRLGWIELGGAGLFRPEVVQPLGITVPVIAWGLGLDRMAMVALEMHDIRDLFTADLDMIRSKSVQY